MKTVNRFFVAAGLIAGIASVVAAAVWSSSDNFGGTVLNGYELNNGVWGSGVGPQTIWANSGTNWGVWTRQPDAGGVKSYPRHERYVNRSLSSMRSMVGTFNVSTPSTSVGRWSVCYDLWDTNYRDETMVWMNYTGNADGGGNIKPISFNYDATGRAVPVATNVLIAGHRWNIFRGNFGTNCTTFIRTTRTNSGTVDLLALLRYAQSRGYIGNQTVGSQEFGFEISSTYDTGQNFGVNNSTINWN
ncbi:MAG: glycosyl hydrolase [Fibrella sp.]|nr:glycosyl hydrolase [Armatimonadota bacterium]